MAAKRRKKKKSLAHRLAKKIFGRALPVILIVLLLLGVFLGMAYEQYEPFRDFVDGLGIFSTTTTTTTTTTVIKPTIDPDGDEMAVHYIDVGQGDSTLLQTTAGSVLIDCGEVEYGETVVEYLRSQGISELEYFIITHPDSDHMGCAAYVLQNINVKRFVINGKEKSAKFFTRALDAMEERGVEGIIAKAGDVFEIGALRLDILGPYVDDINSMDSNESSLIIRAGYGKRVFLFTGDAEKKGEQLLLDNNSAEILKCDVFSAGHHGSRTSNSSALLTAVSPAYIVISCGAGNSYGHPHEEALDNFEKCGAEVIRTDISGTVIFVTDGESLTYSTLK